MKRWTFGLALALASLALSSCDAFFEMNLFKEAGLGQIEVPSASKLSSMSLSELEGYADSPAFFDELASDQGKKDAVVANLEGQMASSDPGKAQGAAALCAEVLLKTTDAFDAVNGVFAAASELASVDFDAMTEADFTSFIEAALPADTLEDEASFKEAIIALLEADGAYDALGASIGSDGLAPGVDPQTFVQAALLATLVDGVDGGSDAAKADALWAALQGTPGMTYTPPDFSAGTPIDNIIAASGFDLGEYGL